MGSVVERKRRDKTYMYYVYYDGDGKRIESYCGAKEDPKSKKKILQTEMTETEMLIANLTERLAKLKAQIADAGR